LDTWFSSWLWPISVFDGIRNPENEEVNYYYPTKDLVTGPDILFFWVARMIISGYEYRKEKPFSKVYLTGLVRDKQGRKMSKQLGNSPDALKLIEDFGADAVRVGLMLSSAAGNDLLFDESLCQQGKNFSNKIWNAYRLIEGWEVDESGAFSVVNKEALHWYSQKFQQSLESINDHFEKYRISDALMTSYKLIWDDFCSWLLEAIKPAYGDPIDGQTYREVRALFEENLKLLHPFMPFLTEELWQDMEIRSKEEALIVSKWPVVQDFEADQIRHFDETKAIIGGIRNFRKEKELGFKETLSLQVIGSSDRLPFESLVQKMGQLTEISYVEVAPNQTGGSFRANNLEFFIPLEGKIDLEKERLKLEEELKYANGFLMSVQKKLSNERFVSNAPEQVLANERKKETDALEKIEVIKKSLSSL
jgi:valyl-tRNA synthetase